MNTIWLLEFIRWPGYDSYEEVVGVYSSTNKAKEEAPTGLHWVSVGEPQPEVLSAIDSNDDKWFIYPVTLDAPIEATYPTWEDEDKIK